jgi:excisionase family DNA binding protein
MAGTRRITHQAAAGPVIYESVDELARELRISRQTAYAGLRQGKIPSIRLGKRFIIARSAIAEWLRNSGMAEGSTR